MMTHPLLPKLRKLRLSGMVNTPDVKAARGVARGLGHLEFPVLLLDDEPERRSQKRLSRRLSQSGCDIHKMLADFDFAAAPGVNGPLIRDPGTCTFVLRHENVLFSGPTGVGKGHLANALGVEALKREMKVLSYPLHHLLKSLRASRANGGYSRMPAKVLKVDLLILDDFGLYPLTGQESQDLYEIINGRYERGSVIVTGNRAFREWSEVFHDDLLAGAALDRLTHHAHAITIRGKSYRQRSRGKEGVGDNAASPAESGKS